MLPLGKRPARKGAIRLRLKNYIDYSKLPVPPAEFGQDTPQPAWGVLANDRWGNCVWAGAAHETMIWNRETSFSDAAVLSDYAAVTGFNFTEATDYGTDMQAAAEYRQKTGVADASGIRHRVAAYLAIEAGNVQEHLIASYLFGAVGIGINFPDSAETQFDAGTPWIPVQGSVNAGGHYIPMVARRDGMCVIVTWGKEQFMTDGFLRQFNDESIVYLSEDMLDAGNFNGFDLDQLKADFAALKGDAPRKVSVMPTTKALTDAEVAVATDAIQAVIAARVPGWEQHLIPQDVLADGIKAAVTAIDHLRDQVTAAQAPKTGA